jgi:uncharacterized protein
MTAGEMKRRLVLRHWLLPVGGMVVIAGLMLLLGGVRDAAPAEWADEPWLLDLPEVEALIRSELEAGGTTTLDWRILGQLDYRTGAGPELLHELDGRTVRLPGFLVPLEDYAEEFSEFLVVPYYGACIHTPPPPPNQMVHALGEGGRKVRASWWDPYWVIGTLHVEPVESPYGVVSFRMEVSALEIFEY